MSWETKILSNTRMLHCLVVILLLCTSVRGDSLCVCKRKQASAFLDFATDLIEKAKNSMPSCSDTCETHNTTQEPTDCLDVMKLGHKNSGVYTIWPITRLTDHKPLAVYCDMETDGGGWTVIQRRGNFGRPIDYFYRDWNSYREGFGDIDKDFWLGNDNIFALTNQKHYAVRFDLQDVELNKRYAKYDSFWIDDEFNNYTLHIFNYSGDAGDSMAYHNYQKFSTKDRKNDNSGTFNWAEGRKGAWWYENCISSNLNGLYRRGKHDDNKNNGISWNSWKGHFESLESTEIKIRPKMHAGKNFLLVSDGH